MTPTTAYKMFRMTYSPSEQTDNENPRIVVGPQIAPSQSTADCGHVCHCQQNDRMTIVPSINGAAAVGKKVG